jgi:hypothetical protein
MRRVNARLRMERGIDQRRRQLVIDRPWLTWTQFVMQPGNPPLENC